MAITMDRTDTVLTYLNDIGRIHRISPEDEVRLAKVVQDGLAAEQRLSDAVGDDRPTGEVGERRDRRLAAEGRAAQRWFVEANLRLVVSIAKRYKNRGVDFEDLIQEGNIGLMTAVKKFDADKGFRFSTYATWWIRQTIDRAVQNQRSSIRVPYHYNTLLNRVEAARNHLHATLGREPTEAEVHSEAYVDSKDDIVALQQVAQRPVSLDQLLQSGEGATTATFGDTIVDTRVVDPDEHVEAEDRKALLRNALASAVSPQEARVIEIRFGLGGRCAPATLAEAARRLGVSHQTVANREASAIKKLAVALGSVT